MRLSIQLLLVFAFILLCFLHPVADCMATAANEWRARYVARDDREMQKRQWEICVEDSSDWLAEVWRGSGTTAMQICKHSLGRFPERERNGENKTGKGEKYLHFCWVPFLSVCVCAYTNCRGGHRCPLLPDGWQQHNEEVFFSFFLLENLTAFNYYPTTVLIRLLPTHSFV